MTEFYEKNTMMKNQDKFIQSIYLKQFNIDTIRAMSNMLNLLCLKNQLNKA